MPPVRELTDELASASSLYINKLNNDLGKQIFGFDPDALSALCNYSWPDNYMQLKRVLSDAVIHSDSNNIKASTIQEILEREKTQYALTSPVHSNSGSTKTLQEIIHDAVLAALQDCDGNQTKAAKQLDIGRTTLWRYLKE